MLPATCRSSWREKLSWRVREANTSVDVCAITSLSPSPWHVCNPSTHSLLLFTYADNQDLADYLSHKLECQQCHASLPTAKLLEIHVAEMHDSYWEAQAARKMPVRLSERVQGCRAWHRHAYLFSQHFHQMVPCRYSCAWWKGAIASSVQPMTGDSTSLTPQATSFPETTISTRCT